MYFRRFGMDFQAMKNALPFGKKAIPRRKMTTPFSKGTLISEAPDYPRPSMVRDSFFSLNGIWDYGITKEPSLPEIWKKILVPFPLESDLSGAGEHLQPGEYLWYRRTLEAPSHKENERVILHFGAVDQRCVVFVNHKEVAASHFGYLAFSADITEVLTEGINEISLQVQDDSDAGLASHGKQALSPGGMFYSTVSGIWQTVWMEVVPSVYITEFSIDTDYDMEQVTFTVSSNKKKQPFTVEILCQDQVISGHSEGKPLTLDLYDIHPWTPEDPYLYPCKIKLGEDMVESYFAMRTFTCEKDDKGIPRMCLNHEPYFHHGLLDQAYWPESLYTAPCDEAYIWEIETAKKLGFNMLRMHAKVEAERFYYHCDRLGMIVWQDMVSGGVYNAPLLTWVPTLLPKLKISDKFYPYFFRTNKAAKKEWIQECLQTIHQFKHHPCISTWVIFNEAWGQFDSAKIYQLVKNVDPTRIIDHASGWFDQGVGDLKSVHNYFRELTVEPDKLERPFVLSEYGGYTYFAKYHSMCDIHFGYKGCDSIEALNADMKDLFQNKIAPLIPEGLSAAVYTQLTDIEEEINGIITYDRRLVKIKEAPAFFNTDAHQ